MLYSRDKTLEDQIVALVTEGRITVKKIHQKVAPREEITLRAVYKVVNKLIEAGVLLKAGQHILIDREWASQVSKMLTSGFDPMLGAGERAVYTFTSMGHLDAFWKTIILPLEASNYKKETFFYNPHNFWAYLPERKESEDSYYQHFLAEKRHGFFTLGGNHTADMEFKREYQSEYLQVDLRDVASFRKTDHITILGPFVITVRLSKAVSERIDALYSAGRSMKEILPEIVGICKKPGKIRFVIENNAAKALKLRQSLAKNFYFKLSE
jgi:hypothetical protein